MVAGASKHSFYASVYGYPDLHDWIKYAYDGRIGEGYLYGMTPLVGETKVRPGHFFVSIFRDRCPNCFRMKYNDKN
jgi:hypothetical protein